MLIISREKNERIIIGDDVWVIFLGMKGDRAKIGLNAPRVVPIYREEIYFKIKIEKNNNGTLAE